MVNLDKGKENWRKILHELDDLLKIGDLKQLHRRIN
jgi:hypothetical protein